MTDLLIAGATVVACDPAGRVIPGGGVAVSGGRIAAVLPPDALPSARETAREVVEAPGQILMPGLVNAHCHAGDSLFRGLVEDLPLAQWLARLWRIQMPTLDAETCRIGSTLGYAELLLAGVTTVCDMFWDPRAQGQAARAAGLRVLAGPVFLDRPGEPPRDHARDARAFAEEFANDPHLLPAMMPHAPYSVAPDTFRLALDVARECGIPFHTHTAETAAEQARAHDSFGTSVIRHLHGLGALGPQTILAHCVHLDAEEVALLASTGTAVALNPVSNLKLGSGIADIPALRAADIRCGTGTDGAISGNDLDPWWAMRLSALLPRGAGQDPVAVRSADALAMATREGAAALGLGDLTGSLEPGKAADLILLDASGPHATPLHDPVSHVVFGAGRGDVRRVWAAGREVVRDGRLLTLDLDALRAELAPVAAKIKALAERTPA